ncbi:MAG: Ribosomal RNA small subunit methyltransferase I [Candidatus Omnitrophica bacterium]|nr:Ribosomal RNA small subunit methyltransferase I [Candidatus Omnitrophota bacterium]
MTARLYIVSTPIGNLGDLTYRAVETLKSVDLIACEDTRRTHVLLDHYGIKKPLVSYHDHSESHKAPRLIERILDGQSLALVSDAGTPGIADPGYRLIAEAVRRGVRVEAVPGAAACLAALTVSGLPADRFAFEGFLPVKPGPRRKRLIAAGASDRTTIHYESPHRILKTLEAAAEVLPATTRLVVARELTKKYEEIVRGTAAEVWESLRDQEPRGEYVLLIGPAEEDGALPSERESDTL